ncbi:MAG: RNA-guided pseudouridylation complex pseudouridine synthase subunit Cbf5 [Promethearchaeota archaeon]
MASLTWIAWLKGFQPFPNPEKPPGPTSHEVVSWIKRILAISRAGHSGTLDPQVTGVLPVMLGNATKIANALLTSGKEYICIMRLHRQEEPQKVREAATEFVGTIYQRPPVRSSVKRRVRTRHIYYLDILEIEDQNVLFRVGCQAGTYIRKLVYDLGEVLGSGAHMAELRRTRTGPFKEDNTLATLYDVKDAYQFWHEDKDDRLLRQYLQPLENGVQHLPQIIIRDTAVDAICHGANLAVTGVLQLHDDIEPGDYVALMTLKGELVALGIAQQKSQQILQASSGIVADTKRVVLAAGTYPSSWRKKTKDTG